MYSGVMAARHIFVLSAIFTRKTTTFGYATTDSGNTVNGDAKEISMIQISTEGDMKYPSKSSGIPPWRSRSPRISTALKLKAGTHLLKISFIKSAMLYYSAKTAQLLQDQLNSHLFYLPTWFAENRLSFGTSKCKFIIFGIALHVKLVKLNDVNLYTNNYVLDRIIMSFKYLGVILNQPLTWSDQIEALLNKTSQRIGLIKRITFALPEPL